MSSLVSSEPSPFTQATRTSCTCSLQGRGRRDHGPSNDPAHGESGPSRPGPGHLPSNAELTPNSSPNSKGVKCHRGAQKADKQMETSNCAAPSSTDPPAPSARRAGTADLPGGAHARLPRALPPRPGRDRRCPAGSRGRGSRLSPAAVTSRHSALGSSPPSSARVPRTAPAAHAPAPRRPRQAEPWAHARPACPCPRPEGTARRRRGRGWAAAAYLGPGQRSSRATLAPQSGPEQRAAGAGGSCSAPGHPPTRRRLRAAPAAGRSAPSAAGAGERERASERGGGRGAGTGPARSRGGRRCDRSGRWRAPGREGAGQRRGEGSAGPRCPRGGGVARELGGGGCGGRRGRAQGENAPGFRV